MKIKILLILVTFLAFSCGNDDDTIPSKKEYSFKLNTQIQLEELDGNFFAQTIEGENLVFKYRFIGENDPDISDEEFSEDIIFEIDPTLDNFLYSNDELIAINTYFTKYCFCNLIGSISIHQGSIEGTKLSDSSWSISIDVTFMYYEEEVTKSANGTFTLE